MLLVNAVGVQISRSTDALFEEWKTCRSRVCVLINKRSFEPAMCLDLEGLGFEDGRWPVLTPQINEEVFYSMEE